ncbi:MAG: PH domain-containing protein [Hyphomonadaceae bacterium]
MSYLERAISADERIEHTAKTHWVVYILPVLFIPVYGIGLIFLFFAWLYTISTDLGVTNKRVIGKWGFISRRTIEQRLDKIEGVQVHQGILGRILNYGTIIVTGTGGSGTPIPNIANPLEFRSAVNAAMDSARSGPAVAAAHAPAPAAPAGDVRERLEKLDQLRRDGLVNDEEYAAKRSDLISQL